jgi:hypothetical protein
MANLPTRTARKLALALCLATWAGAAVAGGAGVTSDPKTTEKLLAIRASLLEQTIVTPYLKDPWANSPAQTQRRLDREIPSRWPWRERIKTTVFWIGEKPAQNNPVPNDKSSWDGRWEANYGGYDCPKNRIGFRPAGFIPRQNPFYIALPYNDVDRNGTKPEASKVIPWFHREFQKNGHSVVKGRWIAIRHKGRICYAQWEDCGPFRTDHWAYVFGNARPSPNRNGAAGLDVSPAVRDYLGMGSGAITDWKFVEVNEIPRGPWSKYGENNPFSPQFRPKTNMLAADSKKSDSLEEHLQGKL